ncbi:MAG: inorganic diphosphatase [Ruminiclostridium sp.]|nr:inorganic diphosphatase [Ruminiclostridium sp.]
MIYTAIIEQTSAYQKRMKYIAETDSFIQKDYDSLFYARSFKYPYGWIKESGTPPEKHLDVLIMTDKEYDLGDEERVRIIGVFLRNDGDNKLVAVTENREINDLSELSESERDDLHRLYPREDKGEGWFGRDAAEKVIKDYFQK